MYGIDATIIVAIITLIGVVLTNLVTYNKNKAGLADAHKAEEERWGRLMDRLDSFDNDLKEHGRKLDKHNGFEGRIIALEVIAEWMEKELTERKE